MQDNHLRSIESIFSCKTNAVLPFFLNVAFEKGILSYKQTGMRNLIAIGVLIQVLVGMSACKSTSYYHHESENKTFTELQFDKNGTFQEYVYFSMSDSLYAEDFGTMLEGTFTQKDDTLFMAYNMTENNAVENEIYLKKGDQLIQLEPITYSHHFLNMVFTKGKSTNLRKVPNYETISWNDEF